MTDQTEAPEMMWREAINPSKMYPDGGSFYYEKPTTKQNLQEYVRADLSDAKDKRIAELEVKLAKAVDALTVVDLLDPEGATSLCSHPALTSIVLRMGATARKTLAEIKGTTQ